MMMTRRSLLLATGSALALTACVAPPPASDDVAAGGSVNIAANMAAGANPGPDGSGRPLSITVLQLRTPDAFNALDFVALQSAQSTLAADLVRADTLVLAPGGSATGSYPIEIAQGATTLGIIAGYRDPGGKVFRHSAALPSTGDMPISISVGPSGLTVT